MADAKKPVQATPRALQIEEGDIEALVDINMNRLDFELQRQAKLYLKFALKLADAKFASNEAKNEIEIIRATTANTIRETPEFYNLQKVTEASVSEMVLLQPEYTAAVKKGNEARHFCDKLEAAVNALEHKKRMIEGFISLHGQSYFATPRPKDAAAREVQDQFEKQAARNLKRGA